MLKMTGLNVEKVENTHTHTKNKRGEAEIKK